jgi:arsenate reductase
MSRFGLAFAFVFCVGGSSVAFAQSPGQGPPMPMAMDLSKVPVGSWADYNMTMGTLPQMKMRMALVSKTPAANVVETSVEGGMMASAGGKMVMQMSIAPGMEGTIKKMVMQMGAGDPMEMPVEISGGKPFTKPNPKNLVGTETIKVPAGSFKTKHYRDKTPQGDTIDFWISESVPPFGVVKIDVDQKNSPQIKGKMTFELHAMGKDAKPVVTKPPKPFDQAALMQQMLGAAMAKHPLLIERPVVKTRKGTRLCRPPERLNEIL